MYLSQKLETVLTKTKISVISYKNKCLTNVRDFDYGLQGHNHEEADTLIILHGFQIAKIDPFREVVIVCSDRCSANATLALSNFMHTSNNACGKGRSQTRY